MNRNFSKNEDSLVDTYQNNNECMILRDWLALDRTILANERTVLAWIRTGLSIFLAGITFVKYIDDDFFQVLGYFAIVFGISVFGIGIYRYNRLRKNLSKLFTKEIRTDIPENE
jgi:putative membrane protein